MMHPLFRVVFISLLAAQQLEHRLGPVKAVAPCPVYRKVSQLRRFIDFQTGQEWSTSKWSATHHL